MIGFKKAFFFFARKEKLRGTICFLGGIMLVFLRWPVIGMAIEAFGFINLFGYACIMKQCNAPGVNVPALVISFRS